jgi:hypothetical protein
MKMVAKIPDNVTEGLSLFINAPVKEWLGLAYTGGKKLPARHRLLEEGSMGIRFRLLYKLGCMLGVSRRLGGGQGDWWDFDYFHDVPSCLEYGSNSFGGTGMASTRVLVMSYARPF